MRKFQVTVNGNTYEVDVQELQGGQVTTAPVVSAPVATTPAKVLTAAEGLVKVEAPMQGKIIDLRVSEGSSVNAGDVIAIFEAMKMENEVVAPKAGTVASVNVATGQSVEAGDLIASLN